MMVAWAKLVAVTGREILEAKSTELGVCVPLFTFKLPQV